MSTESCSEYLYWSKTFWILSIKNTPVFILSKKKEEKEKQEKKKMKRMVEDGARKREKGRDKDIFRVVENEIILLNLG